MERIDKVQNLIPEKPEFVHSNQEKGEAIESLKIVNRPLVKKDAAALVTGKSVYTNDLAPSDCLIVKVIRSPYAHALIKDINTARAEAVPGIECVLTYKDCPDKRFTMAGQTYPEPSPYDRLILDQRVRFVGDAAAIVAGTSEEAVKKAMKLVKIQYEVLEPVLDFRTAKDNPILVHPEDNWRSLCPVGADNKRNLCAHGVSEDGDVEAVLAKCDHVIDRVYHTKANQQAMMETFRTYTYLDAYGRLNVVSSTQVPFKKNPCSCTRYSEEQSTCDQAENWWRIRCEADCSFRSLSGTCHMEDRKTGEDHLHKRRVFDRFFTAS